MKLSMISMTSAIALAIAAPVHAQTASAMAATDLNIRSGPGPQFDIIGVIAGGDDVSINGCLDASAWCQVAYGDVSGWASSDYLAVGVDDTAVALTARPTTVTVDTVTYENTAQTEADENTGAAAGATIGALTAVALGGPIGGIIAGGILGASVGVAAVEPTMETVTYVRENPVDVVYLDGEVVVGAGIPSTVTTYEVPQQEYRYLNVNGLPVLVDAKTNTIVSVVR